jgi:hypothetical protein
MTEIVLLNLFQIEGKIFGLRPGNHGFHIHEVGDTSNKCHEVGPHFNPFNVSDTYTLRCTQGDEVGGGGRVNIVPHPQANFKTLANKNAIKPKIGGPPKAIFPESLETPLRILAKIIWYPLLWIFNPCASMLIQWMPLNGITNMLSIS